MASIECNTTEFIIYIPKAKKNLQKIQINIAINYFNKLATLMYLCIITTESIKNTVLKSNIYMALKHYKICTVHGDKVIE